jgi:hypothetical protein
VQDQGPAIIPDAATKETVTRFQKPSSCGHRTTKRHKTVSKTHFRQSPVQRAEHQERSVDSLVQEHVVRWDPWSGLARYGSAIVLGDKGCGRCRTRSWGEFQCARSRRPEDCAVGSGRLAGLVSKESYQSPVDRRE